MLPSALMKGRRYNIHIQQALHHHPAVVVANIQILEYRRNNR